jgi:hypothetical protein
MSAGGRKKWEAAWHTAMERYQNQKSPLSSGTFETPGSSRPGKHVSQRKSNEQVTAIGLLLLNLPHAFLLLKI